MLASNPIENSCYKIESNKFTEETFFNKYLFIKKLV